MVKCVVSSCQNREQFSPNRGYSRAPKRFFLFPKDPARIKVWLAALREPDKQDWTENHVICEDHFVPEDISESGVNPDAIPIMPPCMEEELGLDVWADDPEEDGGWGMAYDHEENDEENEEENDLANDYDANEGNDEADEDGVEAMDEDQEEELEETADTQVTEESAEATDGDTAHPAGAEMAAAADTPVSSPGPALAPLSPSSSSESRKSLREDMSLHRLTRHVLELLLSGDGSMDVREAAKTLQWPKRRIYDVTQVLMAADLLRKESVSRVRWTGKCPISSFLWEKQKMKQEAEKLKKVEDTLDGLIKSCAQQLFTMTDDRDNANSAFITFSDVQNLPAFHNQTVMIVKAPEETKLEVPAPKEDNIQVHLKSGSGPISVLTCDAWFDVSGKLQQAFRQIQHSHIKTKLLQTESAMSL